MRSLKNKRATQGFTLIELLIVIAIIGILAAVLIPNLLQARNRANESSAQSFLRSCVTSVEANRNSVTQELPASGACADIMEVALPTAVSAATFTTDAAADTYTATATASTGTVFTYDGISIQ